MTVCLIVLAACYTWLVVFGVRGMCRLNGVKRRRLPPKQTLLVWLGLGAIAWLDHGRTIHAHDAAVWSFITTAVGVIGDFFSTIGAAVETALTAVVSALAATLSWVLGALKTFIGATGSVFSKVWDGLKVVWNDVLKPVINWVDTELGKLKTWLSDTFGPVFKFLKTVRDELIGVYKRFLAPILNLIDLVHGLDQLLQVFHINLLKGLDATLESLEQRLEEPILWLNQQINKVLNVLTTIITADGLFQRITLLKSLARDVSLQWNMLHNFLTRPLTSLEAAKLNRAGVSMTTDDTTSAIAAGLQGQSNDTWDVVSALADGLVQDWPASG